MPEFQTAVTTKSEIMLEGFVDYAGLYPPANLDMQAVVDNWACYLQSDDSWMLARLIIPASRLDEFLECAKESLPSDKEEMWQLSVLLPAANDENFSTLVQKTVNFNTSDVGAVANVVEFKASSTSEIEYALDILHDDLFPYIELPIDEDPRGLIAALSGAIAGAKVRTGGVTKELYPTSSDLARFIHSCAVVGQPFKATAGMHHPCRAKNESNGVIEFGFLSVLQATIAASVDCANIEEVEQVLTLETVDFSSYSESQLEQVRAELFNSLGACSFDDPRVDLRNMELLKEQV
ncbi:MAG: hypothetical protein QGF07_03470 [Phycisphaerales bacterium]|jgi:hypothetical protein|nr:hypothetical protein [Phycisphaerales bacterium]